MVARQLRAWLKSVASMPQIVHLWGLRQTGKTTLMESFRKAYPDSLHYPLQDLVTLRKYEAHPENWVLEIEEFIRNRKGTRPLQVFVDEIQKIPTLFQGLQGLYDANKKKIKFWIWGSSARPIKRQRAETLAGRSVSRVLWPLTQSEAHSGESCLPLLFEPEKIQKKIRPREPRGYLQFLNRCFQHTLLPEPHLIQNSSQAQEVLSSYQATFLENEIRRENLVQDIGVFEQFLSLAASEDAQILNSASKAKALGISPHTVKNYYGILQDTFVIQTLPAYSQSFRGQISKSPKVYFTDTGLARFISGERGLPQEKTQIFGRLIEGFVINEIQKQIEYHQLPWKLSYLRLKTGPEIDLIIQKGKKKIAIEIKAGNKIEKKDLKFMVDYMNWDSNVTHGLLISRMAAPFKLENKIFNLPIWDL